MKGEAMNKEERIEWLKALAPVQLRALASQRSVIGWATMSPEKLVHRLALVDGVEVPVVTSKEGEHAC